MTRDKPKATRAHFERAYDALGKEEYALTLFVSGASMTSADAIDNVRKLCNVHLGGRHRLDIVDLHQDPAMARRHNILATPTLLKNHPAPLRILVGDMSDQVKILAALDVGSADAARAPGA